MSSKRYDKAKMLKKILTTYIMVKKTRRGGMIKTATTIARPLGRATLVFGKEYGKDYAQKKLPNVTRGIYDDPNLALDPQHILTGRTDYPAPNIKIPPQRYDYSNRENINPQTNFMTGGKSKRNRKRKNRRKTRKNRK